MWPSAGGTSSAPSSAAPRGDAALAGAGWAQWAGLVQRRPWPALLAAAAVLLALSAPVLSIRLGFADAGNDVRSTSSRQAYDLLAKGFGPGFNSPLIVLADGGQLAGGALHHALASTAGVAAVTPAAASPDGKITTMIAFPASKPQDAATHDLVNRLRTTVLPPLAHQAGTQSDDRQPHDGQRVRHRRQRRGRHGPGLCHHRLQQVMTWAQDQVTGLAWEPST